MTLSLRTITHQSAALLGLIVGLSALMAERQVTLGIAAAGGLCLLNLGLWQVVGRGLFAARLQGGSAALPMALWGLKLLLLVGGSALLLAHFPPMAVALGGSVLVAVLLLSASRGVFTTLDAEDA